MRSLCSLPITAAVLFGCSSEHAFLGAARPGASTTEDGSDDEIEAPPPAADAIPEESKPSDKPHDVTGVYLRCDEIPVSDGRADYAYFGCNVTDAQGALISPTTELYWSVRERHTHAELAHEVAPSPYPEWRAAIGFDSAARGLAEIAVHRTGGTGPAGVFAPQVAEPPPVVETMGEAVDTKVPEGCMRLPFTGDADLRCADDAAAWRFGPTNGLVCCTLPLGAKIFGKSGRVRHEARDDSCDWREIQTGVSADGRPLCSEISWDDYTLSSWSGAQSSGADDCGCRNAKDVLTVSWAKDKEPTRCPQHCARIVVRPVDLDLDVDKRD